MTEQYMVIEKRTNNAASISIGLALVGFVLSLIPLLGWFTAPIWVLAILFGVVGLFKPFKRGLAIAGIGIGLLTFIYKISLFQALFG